MKLKTLSKIEQTVRILYDDLIPPNSNGFTHCLERPSKSVFIRGNTEFGN